jgi:prephenate dehydrogenase
MKAGIIGGTGKMGQFFVPVFERAGYEVLVSGRSSPVTSEDIVRQCHLVIVSVPIRNTFRVINRIAPLMKPGQMLCDFTSLKVRPVEAMLKSPADVVGLHPMFGPTVSSLKSQTIIVCPARVEETALQNLVAIFKKEGARCTVTTPEEHDRMMAVVQGLTHYVTLCMADSIRKLGIDIETTQEFTSPVYQIELSLIGRLLSQDPELYADILEENPYVPEVLAACRESAAELSAIISNKDAGGFRAFFEENTRHLGSYCGKGQKTTDALIEYMVKR